MDIAYVSALSALAGSVIGGLTSGFTTWLSQRVQAKAGQLAHDLSRREDLFADFIVAASKTYGEALMTNEPQIQELVALYAMISRMRILCLGRTVACADDACNDRRLRSAEQDDARIAANDEEWGGDRSAEGLLRGCARRPREVLLAIGQRLQCSDTMLVAA